MKGKSLSEEFLDGFGWLAYQAPERFQHEAHRLYLLGERIYMNPNTTVTDLYHHYLLMEKSLTPPPVQGRLIRGLQ